jgi:hypothetical protein
LIKTRWRNSKTWISDSNGKVSPSKTTVYVSTRSKRTPPTGRSASRVRSSPTPARSDPPHARAQTSPPKSRGGLRRARRHGRVAVAR